MCPVPYDRTRGGADTLRLLSKEFNNACNLESISQKRHFMIATHLLLVSPLLLSPLLTPRYASPPCMSEPEPPEKPAVSPLAALAATQDEPEMVVSVSTTTAACAAPTDVERRRSVILGGAAAAAAIGLYGFQRANPVNPIALLKLMEERSPALPDALANGRPTLIE